MMCLPCGRRQHTAVLCLQCVHRVQNFPLINHSRARGLLHKLRFRLMSCMVGLSSAWGGALGIILPGWLFCPFECC